MRGTLKTLVSVLAASGTLLMTGEALAGKGGVVFVHGTGDYPGANTNGTYTMSCSGSGDSFYCQAAPSSDSGKNAASAYWAKGTSDSMLDAVRKRTDGSYRPYAITGCYGAARMPWGNTSPINDNDSSTTGESGSADCVASQIERFVMGPDGVYGTADDITDLVIMTHSGGGNVLRYILSQYTAKTSYSRVKTAAKKVVTMTSPFKGTYLANWVFTSGSLANFINNTLTFFGGSGLFNDDGTKFIQTGQMNLHNADSSKLVSLSNPVNGVTLRSGFGTYPDAAIWDGKTLCGGYEMQAGLNLLHRWYLSQTDSSTYRNGCSDGFLPCQSTGAMGQVFLGSTSNATAAKYHSHHQTRRHKTGCSCGLFASSSCYDTSAAWDQKVRNEVNGTTMAYTEADGIGDAADVASGKWDACGFATTGTVSYSAYGRTSFTTPGCPESNLGNGWCDWDCFAAYGRDAVPTWVDPNDHSKGVASWGADDCKVISTSKFSYEGTNTNSAQQNYTEYTIPGPHRAGTTIKLGTTSTGSCGAALEGEEGSGDTYLRLFYNGTQVDFNDDAEDEVSSCLGTGTQAYLSYLTYTIPSGSTSGTYTVRAGCFGSTTCSGTVAVDNVGSARNSVYSPNFAGDLNGNGYTDIVEYNDAAYCPDSWSNDGVCDECMLAKQGSDGNDCRPGAITACYGLGTDGGDFVAATATMYNPIGWLPPSSTCGNGMCESNECSTCASDCAGLCN